MIEHLATGLFVPYPANGYNFENDLRQILDEVSQAIVARRDFVRNIKPVTSLVSAPDHNDHAEAKNA